MKRSSIVLLILAGFLAATASAYMVHEEPQENDETSRGKRQESGSTVIDSIFNIPITAIKQTSAAAQTWSPGNAATIDSVLKIPVSTLEAVGNLIKNRYRETTPLSASRPPRRLRPTYDAVDDDDDSGATTTPSPAELARRRRLEEIQRRLEAQREQQRRYQEQLQRRRMEQLQRYSKRMEKRIDQEDERTHHGFYRDPFGFNALTKWIVGPHGVFNGHAGHGDGHVYQHYDPHRPLHFGYQGTNRPTPTKPSPVHGSTTTAAAAIVSSSSTSSSSSSSSSRPPRPTHPYQVYENVDEGSNQFAWPNWFGIIHSLTGGTASPGSTFSPNDRIQNKIAPKSNIRFDEPPQNKIAPKDADYYKSKYAKERSNYKAIEEELTGNELDVDLGSAESRQSKVLFPSD